MSAADDREDSTTRTVLIILAVFGVLFILLALVCGGGMYLLFTKGMDQLARLTQGPPSPAQALELQDSDYANERAKFKTNLISQGSSPQTPGAESPAPGVVKVDYPSGTLKLRAWVTPPGDPSNPRRPAVLFLHAGNSFDQSDWEKALPYQNAGLVVMVPLLRGENGLPGNFSLLYDEVDDAIHAGDYLANRPDVDADHIYLAGEEIGASLALLTAESTKRFRAAASIAAPWDPVAHARGKLQNGAVRFNVQQVKEYTMRSPVAFATSFKCPVRLYAPTGAAFDQSSREATEVAQRAKTKGLDVESVLLPGNQIIPAAIQASIEFFKKNDQAPILQPPPAVKSTEGNQSSKLK